jgi:hypothetical protein
MWMRGAAAAPVAAAAAAAPFAPIAGGSPEADDDRAPEPSLGGTVEPTPAQEPGPPERRDQPELAGVALLFGAAIVFFGIFPSPLFNFAAHAGQAIAGLF